MHRRSAGSALSTRTVSLPDARGPAAATLLLPSRSAPVAAPAAPAPADGSGARHLRSRSPASDVDGLAERKPPPSSPELAAPPVPPGCAVSASVRSAEAASSGCAKLWRGRDERRPSALSDEKSRTATSSSAARAGAEARRRSTAASHPHGQGADSDSWTCSHPSARASPLRLMVRRRLRVQPSAATTHGCHSAHAPTTQRPAPPALGTLSRRKNAACRSHGAGSAASHALLSEHRSAAALGDGGRNVKPAHASTRSHSEAHASALAAAATVHSSFPSHSA